MERLPEISGPARPPASGGAADALVVLLHGWGADGGDLIGLAPEWARALPGARFVSPHAPYVCDENPMGRQWFGFRDRDPAVIAAGAAGAAAIIDRFLDDALADAGLVADRLALVGFSQGAMMALYVALRRARACAAVVGYSGALIGAETLANDLRSRPPVLLAHGDADPVVPFESLGAAVAALGAHQIPVRWHVARGVGHGIDAEGLALGGEFLRNALRG
ncbi:MAG: alpha/beta hydrolase [Alphaproteobacteria bacterium]